MKFVTSLLLPLVATTATARSIWPVSSQATILDDAPKVPGENPMTYCGTPDDFLFHIKTVDLSPNPPLAGHELNITASGTLDKDIEEGAKAQIQIKYGLIKILTLNVDLCDKAQEINMTCPVKAGEITISKSVKLPEEVPPGKYTVNANVVSKDDEQVTCLIAVVNFLRRRPGSVAEELNELAIDL